MFAKFKQRLSGQCRMAALAMWATALGAVSSSWAAEPFVLPTAGCPMAHCDARMSDAVNARGPLVASRVAFDRTATGGRGGLGCVSNLSLVACTGAVEAGDAGRSALLVYDAMGRRVWEDGGLLGPTAWLSAPVISERGQVLAADQDRIVRVDVARGEVVWQAQKPDAGTPISPVIVGQLADMILLATKAPAEGGTAELSVWDLATGALLDHGAIVDPDTGRSYATLNTPASNGARAYVLTSSVEDGSDGRLYAIDICESPACGGRGTIQVAWHSGFTGPSSASPVRIGQRLFFDGMQGRRGGGTFMAVDDLGDRPAPAWTARFPARFGASAAQDPRGGVWVAPWQTGQFLRLNELNGRIEQTLDVGGVLSLGNVYSPVTAFSVSTGANGAVVLTFGAQTKATTGEIGPQVAAVDVAANASGSLVWRYRVASEARINAATGQFPVVITPSGARRVVFKGTRSGTFFVGEP